MKQFKCSVIVELPLKMHNFEITLTCLTVILFCLFCYGNTDTFLYQGSANKVKASFNCKGLGPGWNLPDGNVSKPELIKMMIQHDINTVWSQITRAKLPKWLWINGSECEYKMY